jgi:hypothetical protein
MNVACGVDIRSPLMDRRMNYEASSVDESIGAAYTIAVLVHVDHVGDFEKCKMHTVRINPKGVWSYGIYAQSVRYDFSDIERRRRYLEH